MNRLQKIRDIADYLDLRLGVEARKLILAGNEKITMGTKDDFWNNWAAGMVSKIASLRDPDIEIELSDRIGLNLSDIKLKTRFDDI
jgi:hypothetical protein